MNSIKDTCVLSACGGPAFVLNPLDDEHRKWQSGSKAIGFCTNLLQHLGHVGLCRNDAAEGFCKLLKMARCCSFLVQPGVDRAV